MDIYPICSDQIIIQQVEDYFSFFSPLENRGIIVAEHSIKRLLRLCNGEDSIKTISDKMQMKSEALIKILSVLHSKGIIFYKDEAKYQCSTADILDCWFHVTNKCNLKCTYCYIHKSEALIDTELAKNIVKKLVDSCTIQNVRELHVRFSGGEPLLCKEKIQQIIDYADGISTDLIIRYGILTNGTLIDYDTFTWLKKNKISISISLDGIGNFNDMTRCYPDGSGSYVDIIRSIDLLRTEKYPVGIMTTITKGNLNGLPALTKMLAEKRLMFRFSLEKTNRKGTFPELCRYVDELIDILNQCLDIMENQIDEGNVYFQFQFCDIQFKKTRARICNAGDKSLAVDHNGNLAVCGMGLVEPCVK